VKLESIQDSFQPLGKWDSYDYNYYADHDNVTILHGVC